jgi:hypothetical protein
VEVDGHWDEVNSITWVVNVVLLEIKSEKLNFVQTVHRDCYHSYRRRLCVKWWYVQSLAQSSMFESCVTDRTESNRPTLRDRPTFVRPSSIVKRHVFCSDLRQICIASERPFHGVKEEREHEVTDFNLNTLLTHSHIRRRLFGFLTFESESATELTSTLYMLTCLLILWRRRFKRIHVA